MSLVRVIIGSELSYSQVGAPTSGKDGTEGTKEPNYLVPPLKEGVVNPKDDELFGLDLALDNIFKNDNPTMLSSDDNQLVDYINGVWAGGTPDYLGGEGDIATAVSFIDIVNDEWSK